MKKTPFDVDSIWLRLRSPFRYPKCAQKSQDKNKNKNKIINHESHDCCWERFDADRAGCVLCGSLHRCSGTMIGCECPLEETDEHYHVCLITGLCMSEVRTACTEFVDNVCFDRLPQPRSLEDEGMYDRVASVVRTFLTSSKTIACRRLEREKCNVRTKQAFWRVLKQRKRDSPYELPCLCSVVAEVASSEQCFGKEICGGDIGTRQCQHGREVEFVDSVVKTSAANISCCIHRIHWMGFRKICQGGKFQSMVVGMLYMSRTGLRVGDLFKLPVIRDVQELLPSETYLNSLGVSNKVICDTENEIKSCIRSFTESGHVIGVAGANDTCNNKKSAVSKQSNRSNRSNRSNLSNNSNHSLDSKESKPTGKLTGKRTREVFQ